MISRPTYMNTLLETRDPATVKILRGVRRCGKSTLLKMLGDRLVTDGVPPNAIIEIDLELLSNAHLKDSVVFYEYVKSRMQATDKQTGELGEKEKFALEQRRKEKSPLFLFIDEIQELQNWAQTINGIRAEFIIDIYATGSNSRMFSGEDLTYLAGRYIAIDVYPLSFAEYQDFKASDVSSLQEQPDSAYSEYLSDGSFPAVVLASNKTMAKAMLDGLYDSVFSRDILLRGGIRNEAQFLNVAAFVLDNIGNQTSVNAITNTLKSAGHVMSVDTVDNYLTLMCNAYLLYKCQRYDIRGRSRLKTNGKYYVVDTALRDRVLGSTASNRGHITENMVFLELLRRGYDVTIGTLGQSEIDFVAQRHSQTCYIQVCETVLDPAVLHREIKPFSLLHDSYPCLLITKDASDYSTQGIRHLNLYSFLAGADI